MKRIICLLLSFLMVSGAVISPVFASTDTLTNSNEVYTADYWLGKTITYNTNTDRITKFPGGNSVADPDTAADVFAGYENGTDGNVVFKLSGYNEEARMSTGYLHQANVLLVSSSSGVWSGAVIKRLTAKIKLPSVTDPDAETRVFVPQKGWDNAISNSTFGIVLKNGGAYYYDMELGGYVNFVADGTMNANEWYSLEAIMDCREAGLEGNKLYMNAFVYDDNGILVGNSGYKYVASNAPYTLSSPGSFFTFQINARKYDKGSYILIDDFYVYAINDVPSYGFITDNVQMTNKYITMKSEYYRTLGDAFSRSANSPGYLTSTSDNKAVRVQLSYRIPAFGASAVKYSLLSFLQSPTGTSGLTMKAASSGTLPFTGTVQIDSSGSLVVYAYNTSTSKYDTPVTLSSGGTSYTISAGVWYDFTWDISLDNFSAPTAMLYVRDKDGNLLTSSAQAYAAMPITYDTSSRTSIQYCTTSHSTSTIEMNLDNTKVYVADSVANLDVPASRTAIVEDTFDHYGDDNANGLYNIGGLFTDIAKAHNNGNALAYLNSNACIAAENMLTSGTKLDSLEDITLSFTYTQPIPLTNITKNTIKFLADGVEMTNNYTINAVEDVVGSGTTKSFSVTVSGLTYGTDYALRFMAGLSDYNAARSGGVPADSGLYKDICFSTVEGDAQLTIEPQLLDDEDDLIRTNTLASGGKVKAKVAITNNGTQPQVYRIILAVYKGNRLVDAVSTSSTVAADGVTIYPETELITAETSGLTAKVFVWNSFELMEPLAGPYTLEQQAHN